VGIVRAVAFWLTLVLHVGCGQFAPVAPSAISETAR